MVFSPVSSRRHSLLATSLFCSVAVIATPVFAQTEPAPPTAAEQPVPAPAPQAEPAPTDQAPADQAPADPVAEEGGDTIVVTGSLFRRTDTETASPVTVLSAENLTNAGVTNISDAIRSIAADNSGSIPTAFTSGFGAGSSAVALRGLTSNSTLTLIDGLRTAYYPLADDGQRSFVDLNTVSEAVIDRIEVLKDGASSTYGADAIGGVVNVILKKEFTGIAGMVEGGINGSKDGGEQRASLTMGTGSLEEKGYNFYISGEYQHNDRILNRNRGFPFNTADLTSIGGDNNNAGSLVPGASITAIVAPTTVTDPDDILSGTGLTTGPWQILNPAGCPVGANTTVNNDPAQGSVGATCEQNLVADYGEIQPSQTRFGLNARATVQVNDTTQAYLTASFNQSQVKTGGTPRSIRSVNPIFANNIFLPATLSDGSLNPNNPFAAQGQQAAIRYLFGDIPFGSEYKNHVFRAAAGIEGEFGDGWRYTADITTAHSWLDITQRGYINVDGLTAAIKDGTYNFVNPELNSDAVRASISPVVNSNSTSDLSMIQGTISKEVFELPGGPLQVAVGGAFRYEAVNNPSSNPNNTTFGLNAVTAVGDRTVASGFFELSAPVFEQLEVSASGRYDRYQEGFNRFSPKFGVKFKPFQQLAIRGTFSKGFRAPSFAETSGSVVGFTSSRLPCAAQQQHGATLDANGNCVGGSGYNQSYAIGFNTAGNPDIKPELSRSFTGGAVFEPFKWLSLTVDYYNIKKTQIITGGPLADQAIDAYYAGTALPEGYSVTLDSVDPAFPTAIRRVLFVNAPYANASALKTSGIDFSAQVRLPITDTVKFTSRADVTKIFEFKFKSDDASPYDDYVGTQAPYITSSGAGTPEWRASWQNTLELGAASLSATAHYVSGYDAVAADQFGGTDCATSSTYQGSDPNFNCRVKRYIDVDLVGSLDVSDRFTFYFNVINLFDAKAPLNAGNYAGNNYNPTYTQSGAVGRLFRMGARFKL